MVKKTVWDEVEASPSERREAYVNGLMAAIYRKPRVSPYNLYTRQRCDWFDGFDKATWEAQKLITRLIGDAPDFKGRGQA